MKCFYGIFLSEMQLSCYSPAIDICLFLCHSEAVLRGMERNNSVSSGIRARQQRLFCTHVMLFYGREGDGYNTLRGKKSARLLASC